MEKWILTPEHEAALKNIAERLPRVPVKVNEKNVFIHYVEPKKGFRGKRKKVVIQKKSSVPLYSTVLGQALIDNDVTLADGEKIIPHKRYNIEVGVVNVDHFKNLKDAYLKAGPEGTAAYITKIKTS